MQWYVLIAFLCVVQSTRASIEGKSSPGDIKRAVVQRLSAQYRAGQGGTPSISVAEAFYGSSPAFVQQDNGGGNVSHHNGHTIPLQHYIQYPSFSL